MTFLSITAGIFAAILVYGLFDIDFSNSEALTNFLLKSFVTAIGTGFVLGVLNMFLRLGISRKKKIHEV